MGTDENTNPESEATTGAIEASGEVGKHLRVDQATRDFERQRDEQKGPSSGPGPESIPGEEAAAPEQASPGVAEAYREQLERGAANKGEGRIP